MKLDGLDYNSISKTNNFELVIEHGQEVWSWKLKTNKAKRTSDIETKFVKYSNPVISVFLSKLINSCIGDGIYPDSLKVGEVIPIFKNGVRDRTTNYRPISFLSHLNKVFEKSIIQSHLFVSDQIQAIKRKSIWF